MRELFRKHVGLLGLVCGFLGSVANAQEPNLNLDQIPETTPKNVVFVLVDDLRFDGASALGHPFLETPNIDRLATEGANFKAAYVTTSLCSPSRASILTGQYAHTHQVVDNNNPVPKDTIFFPQYLQKAGYETAFFGKWHMGHGDDEPRPGFDRWVSFRGQGSYLPNRNGLNVDGERVPQKGYITDELTDYCLQWLNTRTGEKPFFIYLSHKAVHSNFQPAERHQNVYEDAPWDYPSTMALTDENFGTKPRWVKDQRNSWHGVDYPYHSRLDVEKYHKRYCETLLAVDEGLGKILSSLNEKGWGDDTLVMFMGDNGFAFGEHGLIDKRTAYEPSMRVPLLARCPSLFEGGKTIEQVVANIDIGPTVLNVAGLQTPDRMQGRSFLPLLTGEETDWRDGLLYEYYWERNFPQTPTMHAWRTDKWKYIHYIGVWDTDELYDLENDPEERYNLVNDPQYKETIAQLKDQMFSELESTGGMSIPLYRHRGNSQNLRSEEGSDPGDFPPWMVVE